MTPTTYADIADCLKAAGWHLWTDGRDSDGALRAQSYALTEPREHATTGLLLYEVHLPLATPPNGDAAIHNCNGGRDKAYWFDSPSKLWRALTRRDPQLAKAA